MSDDRDNPLLLAVEHLTKPQRSKVIQGETVHTVELPPLLVQLDEAIRGTIGIGGSGSLPNERNALNNDALFRLSVITSQIKDWCHIAGIVTRPGDKPVELLQRWYIAYTQRPLTVDAERFYTRALTSWAVQIETMFDPPRTHDLPDPCPVCAATSWWNPDDKREYPRPLIVQYKESETDIIGSAKGVCRACAHVWTARELAYAIEEKEREEAG